MVLECRDDDLIPALYKLPAVRGCDQVDSFSCTSGEDHLTDFCRVDEPPNLRARLFIVSSRELAQVVNSSMNIRVLGLVVSFEAFDHDVRLLTGGGVVEVDE